MKKDTTPTETMLRERIKELSCLYNISLLIASHTDNISDTFSKMALVIKDAWLYSDQAIVSIKTNGIEAVTSPLVGSTEKIEEEVKLHNNALLRISVHYPSSDFSVTDFLEEEKRLLKKLTLEIASFLNIEFSKEQGAVLQRGLERNDRLSILGEMTAGIAHELNTPLANILGYTELLQSKLTDEQQRKDVSKIIKSVIYAREVVKKLMFFTSEMPQDKVVQPIKPIIDEALQLLQPNLKKAAIQAKFTISNETISLKIDKIQFMQLLFNLIINALYVSPTRSTIYIDVNETEKAIILKVSDEGTGVPDTLKEKVFEPFFTTKPSGQGSGLGLSVVHGIVKSHQGHIAIRDNKPKGAVFSIELPKTF